MEIAGDTFRAGSLGPSLALPLPSHFKSWLVGWLRLGARSFPLLPRLGLRYARTSVYRMTSCYQYPNLPRVTHDMHGLTNPNDHHHYITP